MIATLVRKLNRGTGDMRLYRCAPPLANYAEGAPAEYVVVSATVIGAPETYIFAADQEGNITDWGEMPGSFKGGLDHEEALLGAGYVVSK